jgi:probable HAF family extracellular repeat protein
VLVVSLAGDVPERTLLRLARELRDRIENIPAVLEARIVGTREELVEIIVDPIRAQSYGLSADAILQQVSRGNQVIAAGSLDTGRGRFSVQVPGLLATVRDIMTLPVVSQGDRVVRVGDIAEVRRGFRDREAMARVNGRQAVTLEVSKRTGENIIDTIEQVRRVVEAERANWPDAVVVGYSQTATGTEAFRWTTGQGMMGMGDFPGGVVGSTAFGVSADGNVVVGSGTTALGSEAFRWKPAEGMISLRDFLKSHGVANISGWQHRTAYSVSADGKTIVGSGTNPQGQTEAWIATVPEPTSAMLALLAACVLVAAQWRSAKGRLA